VSRSGGRRRILLVADSPRFGGAERLLIHMARAGLGAGDEVSVMGRPGWLLERVCDEAPGVRPVPLERPDFRDERRRLTRLPRLSAQVWELARLIRQLRPDILQSSNGGHPGSALCLMALPAAALAGAGRRVLAVHAVPRPRPAEPLAARAHAAMDAMTWRSAHRVWGATEIVGRDLSALRGMPSGLYQRLPYGVAEPVDDGLAPRLRAGWGAGGEDLVVGMVSGTSDAGKGHAVLVEALGQAPREVRGVIVGAEPPDEVLARARELQLGDRLVVAGRVPDIAGVYHAFDVLCVPSIYDESLPLVVLEAFAAGTPVIASRLTGLPEAVVDGFTGRLFEPGDHAALARLLGEVAKDRPAVLGWGRAAREQWRRQYSVAAFCAGVLAVWDCR
jgi:glycosyltransferase involved in cell wall biosynthesis